MNYQQVTTTQIFNGEALAMVKKGDCAGVRSQHYVIECSPVLCFLLLDLCTDAPRPR
jgi:hypothetical protein